MRPPLEKHYTPITREAGSELVERGDDLIPGTHYEVNESTSMPGTVAEECTNAEQYVVYGRNENIPHLQRFRSEWILCRRVRPVVPVLRGPMPHRGVKSQEQRARLLSLYLRPWVMQETEATIYVPHIRDLDAVRLHAKGEATYPHPVKRHRLTCCTTPSDVPWATRSYARAWQTYIRGNVVSEYSARLIQSFLTIMSGTGKLEHDEESGQGGRLLRKDLGSPGQRVSMADVHEAMLDEFEAPHLGKRNRRCLTQRIFACAHHASRASKEKGRVSLTLT